MIRISGLFDEVEAEIIIKMAKAECRHPREQLRVLAREALIARGWLSNAHEHDSVHPQDLQNAPSR